MTLYLEDNRRKLGERIQKISEWIQKTQHVCAGLPILFTGLKHLKEGSERSLGAFEIALAGCVLFTFIKEFRELRHTANHRDAHRTFSLGWFDLAAGALLLFEAFHGHHSKPGYLRPQFAMGLVILTTGIFHGHLYRRRQSRCSLKVDDSGMELRFSRFRRLTMKWPDVSCVEIQENEAVLHRINGEKKVLKLSRFANGDAALRMIAAQAKAAGLIEPKEIK